MRMLRIVPMIGLMVLCAFQFAAAEPKGTLRVALSTMPNALEVASAAERNAVNAAFQLYDSLVWVNEEGTVEPALAERWDISEDGTTYTFHLRRGVTFHNGEPFTADAVVYSWERGVKDEMPYKDRFKVAHTVEKIDDHTVKMTTGKEPNPLLLRYIANDWGIIAPRYHMEVGETGFLNHPVGTGPFVFKEWKKGDRIVYEANPNYWDKGLPKIKHLIFRPIPESSTRMAAVKTGEVDIVARLNAEEAAGLERDKNVKVIKYPVDRVYYMTFNNLTTGKGKPTEDPMVRQALNYAVDVEAIIDALFNGNGRQATGLMTPGNLGYDKAVGPFGYDPEKAKALLKKAGYADGFELGCACPAGAYTNFEQVCEAVQGYLGEVGIKLDLKIMESGKFWDMEANKQLPPMFGDSWSERAGESLPRLKGALGGMNASYSAWSDPKIDDMLARIGRTVNDTQRAAIYSKLHGYMKENPPFIYLYEPVTFEATSTRVKDYTPRPGESYYLKNTSVE